MTECRHRPARCPAARPDAAAAAPMMGHEAAVRYVICGAGAIGGSIGARLHQAGRSVVLLARGVHLASIQEKGLLFRSPDADVSLRIPAFGTPAEVGFRSDDVVLVAVKTQDSPRLFDDLAAEAAPDTPIVCCQNGVANERFALRRFSNVYGAFLWVPAEHLHPGVVRLFGGPSAGAIDVGCYPAGTDHLAALIVGDLEHAGFDTRTVPDVMRWKYSKLLRNLANVLQLFSGPESVAKELAERAKAEARACYAAAGIAWASDEELAERLREVPQPPPSGADHVRYSSTWQSVARATGRTEVDYLNGEIVLLGRLHGVPTPVNEVLQQTTRRIALERAAPGTRSVSELADRLA